MLHTLCCKMQRFCYNKRGIFIHKNTKPAQLQKKERAHMDSIFVFWQQMTANPLLFIAVVLTLGVILVNGWTDAPNAIATCVVTRCMPPKAAILMAAVFNFLGVFVMTMLNATVAETITKMVDFGPNPDHAIIALSAALFAIVLWATRPGVFGIPPFLSFLVSAWDGWYVSWLHSCFVKQTGQKPSPSSGVPRSLALLPWRLCTVHRTVKNLWVSFFCAYTCQKVRPCLRISASPFG